MSELKPTDKGYREALAKKYNNFVYGITQEEVKTAKFDFTSGYKSALEHNNVPELIEALRKIMEMCDGNDPSHSSFYYCAQETLTKAEQNKLIK